MQVYLVGGAVRDRLLGLPARERDWVVVGARGSELEALGYRRVGRDFPVYLHPDTHEEYALARTERKTAPGYHGFEFRADERVTLDEDLARRDLTINAIAKDDAGRIVDPHGGRADLDRRVLRHVSDAFREDPVRILRTARFAARFDSLGFRVADETMALMREMVAAGEADALVPERVWKETDSALGEPRPDVFFSVLREAGALARVYPEIDALFGVPQPARWHPEIDTGKHTMMVLRDAADRACRNEIRFAALVHDLGKGTTPRADWPKHVGHERRGVDAIDTLCKRVGVPNRYRDLAIPVALYHGLCHRAAELRPGTILKVLERLDAFRRPERLRDFLDACRSDARGRTGHERDPYPQADIFTAAFEAASAVRAAEVGTAGLAPAKIGERIRQARVEAIGGALRGKTGGRSRPANDR